MHILITNDDGIEGEGLKVLAECLSKKNDVWVIAPNCNRSAVSNGITINKTLQLKRYGKQVFSSSGLPADCVIEALCSDITECKIDVVISGINRGANIGTDIVYSGTAAAARQASILGYPGIALSIDSDSEDYKYNALADFVEKNLQKLCRLYKPGYFLNINAFSLSSYKGVQFTDISSRKYKDHVVIKKSENCNSDDVFDCLLHGGEVDSLGGDKSDYSSVRSGMISISRVLSEPIADKIDYNELEWDL
ncbi:MAG: 5'/3'-nucleotidase SurE [Treponema sp.]|nr:5'/3'-nucleotidase SurE [Treponema sp.]